MVIGEVEIATTASDDRDILAAQIDPPTFGVLYERYVDAVFGYCLFRLWDRIDAEDATSLTFTRAFEALPKYRVGGGGTFRSWLFTIAHNVVVNLQRGRKEYRSLDAIAGVSTREPGPDDQAIEHDERSRVRMACQRLTEEQRQVIELRMAGLTGAEVAAAMGKSLPAVKMLQVRAIDRLKHLLGGGGELG